MLKLATELEFLKFFFERIQPYLEPVYWNIVEEIKQQFVDETGKQLPEEYDIYDDADFEKYSLQDFEAACNSGVINDNDGCGFLVENSTAESIIVSCTGFTADKIKADHPKVTHIHWYAK